MRGGQPDRHRFYLGIEALDVLGIGGRHDQGMGDELRLPQGNRVGLRLDRREACLAQLGQRGMTRLDAIEL